MINISDITILISATAIRIIADFHRMLALHTFSSYTYYAID